MIAVPEFFKTLQAEHDLKKQTSADEEAAIGREALRTFDRDPAALRKARAALEAAQVKVARAEAELAVAKANRAQASAEESRLSQEWSFELATLRRRAKNPARLHAARNRLMAHIDAVRAITGFPSRAAINVLFDAMQTLGGMDSGSIDPIADYEAFVDDAIAKAEDALTVARREHLKRQEQDAAAQKARKLLA